jgi:CRP-like cAMP-binding protein
MQPVVDFISAYTSISKAEMDDIKSIMHAASVKKNEILHRQGSIPKRVAFIVKGAIRSYYIDENGMEHTTAFKFENQPIVHFESFTQQTPVPLNAIALEPTELIWTSHEEFFGFLEKYPKYEKVLRNILGSSLTLQNEQMKLLRISSARERYESLCEMRPEVIQRVPLKYIASYLHMALETLSRVRAAKI